MQDDHVLLRPRLIVADDDPAINDKLIKRENVGGKTCWFKEADELTENPKICFGMGVSPNCRYHTLQALLLRMDNQIIAGHEDQNGVVHNDEIEKSLNERDKKHHDNL